MPSTVKYWLPLFAISVSGQPRISPSSARDLICIQSKGNPHIEIWKMMRDALDKKDGDAYAKELIGHALPTGFPATIVSVLDERKGRSYLVTIQGDVPDAVIHLTAPRTGAPLKPGVNVSFDGVAARLLRDPVRLQVDVDPKKLIVLDRLDGQEGMICRCYTPEEFERLRAGDKKVPAR
ncbi:MAG: hypothetical protein FJW38_21135 [Acidobacteria bacterium]|nr:hypothetical protein [Acidobacteriota bacterium]